MRTTHTIHDATARALLAFGAGAALTFGAACSRAEVATRDGETATQQRAAANRSADVAHNSPQFTGIEAMSSSRQAGANSSGNTRNIAPRAPGGTPIDTSAYDAEVKRLEQAAKKNASDATTKRELARAYATRAARLTEAQQYRSALGDWRRTVKLDPSNGEAQKMLATITSIFQSMNRPVPAPGEEPPPLPFKQ